MHHKIRIVADTNILISATIIPESLEYYVLLHAKHEKIKMVITPDLLCEFKEVISRAKFGFSNTQVEDAMRELLGITEIVIPSTEVSMIKEDPKDNKVIEAALEGDVKYTVSGDNHLLKLKKWRDIEILTSREFLETIKRKT